MKIECRRSCRGDLKKRLQKLCFYKGSMGDHLRDQCQRRRSIRYLICRGPRGAVHGWATVYLGNHFDVYVQPRYRRKGIGTALKEKAEELYGKGLVGEFQP